MSTGAILPAVCAGVALAAAMATSVPAVGAAVRKGLRVRKPGGRRSDPSLPEIAASIAAGLSAGLAPREAMAAACRHRHGPLARSITEACERIGRGESLERALAPVSTLASDQAVSSLCLALTSAARMGVPAVEPVRAVARSSLAERRSTTEQRAAKVAPLVQLIVALGLVPAAMMLVAAAVIASVSG